MEGLFDSFGEIQNLIMGAIIGLAIYYFAGKNMTYALIGGVVGVILAGKILKPKTA